MKIEKDYHYKKSMIKTLLREEVVTYEILARDAGVSERSIRNKIGLVEVFLKDECLGSIKRKPHVGIWLDANAKQTEKLRLIFSDEAESKKEELVINSERTDEIIKLLFQMKPSSPLTLAKLSNKLFLSIPTAKQSFDEAVQWFSKRGIKVKTVRNRGIKLEAEEQDYRKAFRKFVLEKYINELENYLEFFFPGLNISDVRKQLISVEERWHLEFSDYSFNEIWLCLCIAIYRMEKGYFIVENTQNNVQEIKKHREYDFACDIFEVISKKYNIKIPIMECNYLAEVILCANIISSNNEEVTAVLEYDIKLQEFAKEIIVSMSMILEEDLTDDSLLYHALLQHIRPVIFRLRYGYGSKDEIVGYVKQTYKQVYRAVWSTSPLFETRFDVKITDIELAYIALHVQVALERKAEEIKAILITQSGNSYSQLLAMKIRKIFPRIVDMEIVRQQDLAKEKLKKFKLVFTTIDCLLEENNVVRLPSILTDEAEMTMRISVRKILEKLAKNEEHLDVNCYSLLSPKLSIIQSELTDKIEIIKEMTSLLEEEGSVTKGYYQSVLDRENCTSTTIGNGVAIPHGYSSGVVYSRVCICTLKKPVQWNDEMVDVIFLLAIRMKSKSELKDLQLFYKYFIKITESDEKLNRIKAITSGAEMYKFLIS